MNFYFFVLKRFFIILQTYYRKLYEIYINEEVYSKLKFTIGKRQTHKNKKNKKNKKMSTLGDTYKSDKEFMLKRIDNFFYEYGTFVNKHGGPMDAVAIAWNNEIWKPMRKMKTYLDMCEPLETAITPPPSPDFSSVFSDTPPESPRAVRRAIRPYREFKDVKATSEEDKCKICMVNKKVIGFFPCSHVGICNGCCKNIYKKFFKISNTDNKPRIVETVPLPPTFKQYEDDEEFINGVISELTQPNFHMTRECVFCKEKINIFKIIYSI